jgi:hypothetical protein
MQLNILALVMMGITLLIPVAMAGFLLWIVRKIPDEDELKYGNENLNLFTTGGLMLGPILHNIHDFFRQMHLKQLCGNIIRDKGDQLGKDEIAGWTGEKYRLVLRTGEEKESYVLVLQEKIGGIWSAFRIENDPKKFHQIYLDFAVREG